MYPSVHSSTVFSSQDVEATCVHQQMNGERTVVHTCDEMLLRYKINEIMPFAATWVYLKHIMLSDISQRKTNAICTTYIRNLKTATN